MMPFYRPSYQGFKIDSCYDRLLSLPSMTIKTHPYRPVRRQVITWLAQPATIPGFFRQCPCTLPGQNA